MFPNVNYIGNKRKLTEWIISLIPDDVETVTDAFAGGSSVSYGLKESGYSLVSNDALFASFVISKALVENNDVVLNADIINSALEFKVSDNDIEKYSWLENHLYFPSEIHELTQLIEFANANLSGYEYYMYLSLLRRSMIRKLPYSRMNITWDNIVKLRDEDYSYKKYGRKRAYHNQSFGFHMLDSLNEYNLAIFKGKNDVVSEQLDILELLEKYPSRDLLYLDPPYPGTMNNYDGFYGGFDKIFNENSSHMDLTKKQDFLSNFDKILNHAKDYKYVMMSFNNSIKPDYKDLINLLSKYGKIKVYDHKHNYQVSGSSMKNSNVEKLAVLEMNK